MEVEGGGGMHWNDDTGWAGGGGGGGGFVVQKMRVLDWSNSIYTYNVVVGAAGAAGGYAGTAANRVGGNGGKSSVTINSSNPAGEYSYVWAVGGWGAGTDTSNSSIQGGVGGGRTDDFGAYDEGGGATNASTLIYTRPGFWGKTGTRSDADRDYAALHNYKKTYGGECLLGCFF